jgi:hypothetical protein
MRMMMKVGVVAGVVADGVSSVAAGNVACAWGASSYVRPPESEVGVRADDSRGVEGVAVVDDDDACDGAWVVVAAVVVAGDVGDETSDGAWSVA